MTREPVEIDVRSIVISEDKASYILDAHSVEVADVFEVASHKPRYFADARGRFAMVGPLTTGRFLLAAIMPTTVQGEWRLITAHWLSRRNGLRIYGSEEE